MFYLMARNLYCPLAVVFAGGPVLSLTTHGSRINTVHFAIESIGRGALRPSRLILWLDNPAAHQNPPHALRRLVRRGLEIRLCGNYGPHTKYFPYLQSESRFDQPLVTADDDILYPRSWLKRLDEAFKKSPGTINCNFARRIHLKPGGIARFVDWQECDTTVPSFRHHALGIYGAIYPPAFLAELKRAGTEFMRCCPKADDLWLHVQALRAGYKIRQVSPLAVRFLDVPGTEETALFNENGQGGNDEQVKQTYSATDIEILRQEPMFKVTAEGPILI